MQELWVYLYALAATVGIPTIYKGCKSLFNNWKTNQLKKIIHADKRKNGKSGHHH